MQLSCRQPVDNKAQNNNMQHITVIRKYTPIKLNFTYRSKIKRFTSSLPQPLVAVSHFSKLTIV